jgi:acyl-CoA synthetase (AMP-forming)/AMP-acid ligase II
MKVIILPILLIFAWSFLLPNKAVAHPAWAIVVDDKNQIYLSDLVKIWKIDAEDKVSVFVDKQHMLVIVQNPSLFSIAVDTENNVYTADFTNKKVLKIAPDKKISILYQSETDWLPSGVYYRNKNLYILENKNVPSGSNPIVGAQKIAADGKVSTVATIGETRTTAPTNTNQEKSFSSISNNQNQPANQSNKFCAGIRLAVIASVYLIFKKETSAKF